MERNCVVKINYKGVKHVLSMGELCKVSLDNIYFSKCNQELDLISYYSDMEEELLQTEPKALKYLCSIDKDRSVSTIYDSTAFPHAPLIIQYMGDLMFRDLISDTIFSLYMDDENVNWFKTVSDVDTYKANFRYLMKHPLVIDIKHLSLCDDYYGTFIWYAKSNLSRQNNIIDILSSAENKNRKLLRKQYAKVLGMIDKILEEQRYFTEACDFINEKRFNAPKVKTYARYMNDRNLK